MARINHWLFPDLVRQFCEHDDASLLLEKFRWGNGVIEPTCADFRCKGKTSRSNLVWVCNCSEIDHFIEITDGAHVLLALVSPNTQHEGNWDLNFKNFVLELVDFDVCVLPNPPPECPSLGLYLSLGVTRAHPATRPVAFDNLRPISQKANVISLQDRLRGYLQTLGPRVIANDTTVANIQGPSHQQQPGAVSTGPQLQSASDSQTRTAPSTSRNPADMAGEDRSETATPLQLQRWDTVTNQKRIPKYGSTAANTSKEQTELLKSDLSWDPPAPGKDRPTNYIPSKDFELLIDLADNPEKYAQLQQAVISQKIAAQAIAMQENLSAVGGQALESTSNSIIAHALQAKARMGTPDATALGASQWPPSPQQVRKDPAKVQETEDSNLPLGEVQQSQHEVASPSGCKGGQDERLEQSQKDMEDDESLPDVGDDRLPPDSDENPSSTAQKSQVSPSTQLVNRTKATQPQDEPQHSIQVPDSNAKAMASSNAARKMLINSSMSQQQSSRNENFTAKTKGKDVVVTGTVDDQNLDSVPATQTRPFPVLLADDADSDADSELEEQAPRGTNETLSSPIAPKARVPFKQPTVQVGRSPQSHEKRSHGQPRKASKLRQEQDQSRGADTAATSRRNDDVIEISSSSKEVSASTYSFNKNSSSNKVHSSGSRSHMPANKSVEASTPDVGSNGKKRKRPESEKQAGLSEKSAKSYRVRPASPDFSQNLLDMANSTPAVDRARREHFKRNENKKLKSSAGQADMIRQPSSKEITQPDPLTQSKSKTSTVAGSTQSSGSRPLSQPTRARQNKETPSSSVRLEQQGEDLLSNFEADVLEEQSMLREKGPVPAPARHKSGRSSERPVTKAVGRHSSSFVPHVTSSLTPDDQESLNDPDPREIDPTTRQLAGQESDDDMQMDEDEPVERSMAPVRKSAAADLTDIDSINSSSRLHPKIRKLMEANSRLSHSITSGPATGLFAKFKATYPKYCGDEKQFIAICKKLVRPKQQGVAIMKLFFDDFVGRYPTEYKLYSIHRIDEGETPDPYEQWFNDNVEAASFKKRILNEAAVSTYLADAQSVQSVSNNDSLLALPYNNSPNRSNVSNMSNDEHEARHRKKTSEVPSVEQMRHHTHGRSSASRHSIDSGQVRDASRATSSDFRAPPVAKLSVPRVRKRSISPPPQPVAKSRSASRTVSTPMPATMPPPQSNRPLRESTNASQKARRATTGPRSPMVLIPAHNQSDSVEEEPNILASDPIDLTGQDSSPVISSSDDDDDEDYVPTAEEIPQLKPRPAPAAAAASSAPPKQQAKQVVKRPTNDPRPVISGNSKRPTQADQIQQPGKKKSRRSLPWQLESGDNANYEADSTPTRVASTATNARTVTSTAPRQHRRATIAPDGETIKPLRASKSMTFTPRPGTSKAVAERLRKKFMEAQAAAAALSGDQYVSSSDTANRPAETATCATKTVPSALASSTAPAARAVPEKPYRKMLEEVEGEGEPRTPAHARRHDDAETGGRKSNVSASASASAGRERPYRRMLEEGDVESAEEVQSSGRDKGKRPERG